MARQTYYVTKEQRHPLYRTRMLQAGPLELDAGAASLYRKLGVELSDEAPKKHIPTVKEVLTAEVVEGPGRKPRRRKAKK